VDPDAFGGLTDILAVLRVMLARLEQWEVKQTEPKEPDRIIGSFHIEGGKGPTMTILEIWEAFKKSTTDNPNPRLHELIAETEQELLKVLAESGKKSGCETEA
jgi:hypothetical protein